MALRELHAVLALVLSVLLVCNGTAEQSGREVEELETLGLAAEARDERAASSHSRMEHQLAREHTVALQDTSYYDAVPVQLATTPGSSHPPKRSGSLASPDHKKVTPVATKTTPALVHAASKSAPVEPGQQAVKPPSVSKATQTKPAPAPAKSLAKATTTKPTLAEKAKPGQGGTERAVGESSDDEDDDDDEEEEDDDDDNEDHDEDEDEDDTGDDGTGDDSEDAEDGPADNKAKDEGESILDNLLAALLETNEHDESLPQIPGHTSHWTMPNGHKEVKAMSGISKAECKTTCDDDAMCSGFKFVEKPEGKTGSECAILEKAESNPVDELADEVGRLEKECAANPSPECSAKLAAAREKLASAKKAQEVAKAAQEKAAAERRVAELEAKCAANPSPECEAELKAAREAAAAIKVGNDADSAEAAARKAGEAQAAAKMKAMQALMSSKISKRKSEIQAMSADMRAQMRAAALETKSSVDKKMSAGMLARKKRSAARMDRITEQMLADKRKIVQQQLENAKKQGQADKLKAEAALMKIEKLKQGGGPPMSEAELAALELKCQQNPTEECRAKLQMAKERRTKHDKKKKLKQEDKDTDRESARQKMEDMKLAMKKKYEEKMAAEKRAEERRVARAKLQGSLQSLSAKEASSKGSLKDQISVEALRKELLYQRKKEMTLKEQIKDELAKRNKEALVKSKIEGLKKAGPLDPAEGIPAGELRDKYQGFKDAYMDLIGRARDEQIKSGQLKQKVGKLKDKGDAMTQKDRDDASFFSDQADAADKAAADLNTKATKEKEKAQEIRDRVKAKDKAP